MEPGVNIDDRHFRALQFPDVSPNIVVVRSDLKFFVKEVDGCVCINPGRLAQGRVNGTFAHIRVQHTPSDKPFHESVSVRICRIP